MRCSCIRAYERVYARGLVCVTLRTREIKRLGRARYARGLRGREAVEAAVGSLRLFTVVPGDVYVASEIEKIKRLRQQSCRNARCRKLQMRELREWCLMKGDRHRRVYLEKIKCAKPKSREYHVESLRENEKRVSLLPGILRILTVDIGFSSGINQMPLGND